MTPNPGSFDAVQLGCRCPQHINQWGRGTPETSSSSTPHHELHPGCPLHGDGTGWLFVAPDIMEAPPARVQSDVGAPLPRIKRGRPRRKVGPCPSCGLRYSLNLKNGLCDGCNYVKRHGGRKRAKA